jgi:hypothetical protein
LLELAKTVHRFGLPYMLRLQKTYRTGWDEMIRGYLETTTMHALLNVGLIDEMQEKPSVDIDEFAARTNLEPAVLQPLCEAFYCLGMFERNGAGYSLSEKGRSIVEVMRGWLEVCYGYSEVFHSLEPLLRKEKVYGRDLYRRANFVARGSGEMENLLFFPMVNDINYRQRLQARARFGVRRRDVPAHALRIESRGPVFWHRPRAGGRRGG